MCRFGMTNISCDELKRIVAMYIFARAFLRCVFCVFTHRYVYPTHRDGGKIKS
jgi:hypothetical protein